MILVTRPVATRPNGTRHASPSLTPRRRLNVSCTVEVVIAEAPQLGHDLSPLLLVRRFVSSLLHRTHLLHFLLVVHAVIGRIRSSCTVNGTVMWRLSSVTPISQKRSSPSEWLTGRFSETDSGRQPRRSLVPR